MCAFVLAIFVTAVVGTTLIDTLWPLPMPKLIGKEGIIFDQLKRDAKFEDGSAARLVERKSQLTSVVRETVTRDYSYYLYRHLGLVRPVALLGKEGWLFHKQRALSPGTDPKTPVLAACSLAAMERTLAIAGIKVVSVCVPRKAVVHSGRLPRGAGGRPELDLNLSRELRAHGVCGPDLLTVFRNSQQRFTGHKQIAKAIYSMTDSHWTPFAEMISARATARDSGLRVPPDQRIGKLETAAYGPIGRDMIDYAGLEFTDELNLYLGMYRSESWKLVDEDKAALALHIENSDAPIVVCGTSFTARRQFANFLAHFMGQRVHNAAQLGGDPTEQLARMLGRGKRPEVVFMEYPNHSLLSPWILRHAGKIYGHLDYPALATVLSAERLPLFPRYREQPIGGLGFIRPVMADVRNVAHSGDGVLAWRVRGEAFGPGVTLRTGLRPAVVDVPWTKGDDEVLVPIVSVGSSNEVRPLLLKSTVNPKGRRGNARIDSVELVLLATQKDPIRLSNGAAASHNGVWFQELDVPTGELVPEHGVLTFNLQLDETHGRNVIVEIRGADPRAPIVDHRFSRLQQDSRHFINLSGFAGMEIESIRIVGRKGRAPGEVMNARILRPRQPLPR